MIWNEAPDPRYSISTWDAEAGLWIVEKTGLSLWSLQDEIARLRADGWTEISALIDREHTVVEADPQRRRLLRVWRAHSLQCRAKTRKGHQCTNYIENGVLTWSNDCLPDGFEPNDPEWRYCWHHNRSTVVIEF